MAMAWLCPPVKPRFWYIRSRRTQGNSSATISAEPSAELLSTRMTSNFASSRIASRLARQARVSSSVFQLQMVMLSSKSGTVSPGTNEGSNVYDSKNQPIKRSVPPPHAMFSQESDQALVRFPNHALSNLLRTLAPVVDHPNL